MLIEIKTNFDLSKLDIGLVNQIGLTNSSQAIKKQAQDNAPYQSGKLRQSIGVEPGIIRKGEKQVRIGPRKLSYSIRREFENFKNPSKRFYMKRAWEKAPDVIKREFENAVNLIIKKL